MTSNCSAVARKSSYSVLVFFQFHWLELKYTRSSRWKPYGTLVSRTSTRHLKSEGRFKKNKTQRSTVFIRQQHRVIFFLRINLLATNIWTKNTSNTRPYCFIFTYNINSSPPALQRLGTCYLTLNYSHQVIFVLYCAICPHKVIQYPNS